MNNNRASQLQEVRTIDGEEALVSTDPEEIYLDLPISSPRYIHVREGDIIQEGDVRTMSRQDMESKTLSRWRIDSITADTVSATEIETDDPQEWDREWFEIHLGTGEFSVELTEFGRVSVSNLHSTVNQETNNGDDEDEKRVTVVVYANNGQQFTRVYNLSNPGEADLLREDPSVKNFDDELRERFNNTVSNALPQE